MKYKKEFQSMRTALGQLCDSTVTLLRQKKIDYLEAVFDLFKLAKRAIQEYNQKVDGFYQTVKVTYGQLLMEDFDSSTSDLESIKFVLDWEENEHLLKDVWDLFKKIVISYSSQVKVIVISEGNSIVVECCIPTHLLPVITRMIQDSEEILNREKVISVIAGGHTIFKRIVTVEQKSELEVEPKKENNYEDVGKSSVHSSDDQVIPSPSVEQETKTNQESLVKGTPETKDDDEESHQKSTVIPTSILEEMKVTSEKIVYFKGSEGYSLDWEEHGCKLHIPKGAIKEEEGELHMYAIYDGPFQFPKGMEVVSGIYYISQSHHELMKPATLEIQHCSDCTYDESSNSGLSFITIPDTTSGPPYSFEIIEGGSFSACENYGMIRRSHFCGFAVAFINKLAHFFGFGLSPNDESSSNEVEKTSEKHSSLGILHFLIANTTKKSCVIIYLIKHLDLHKQHIEKQLTLPRKNIVDRKLKKITLKDEAVQVAVSKAEENSEIIEWKGYPLKIVSQWQISSESTGDSLMLHPDEIEDMLAPSFNIQIDWIGGGMTIGKYSHQFCIHILGIEGAYSFPVSVPLVPFSTSSSVCSVASGSSIDEEEKVLRDPPLLKEFLVNVVKNLSCGSDKLAAHLLSDESHVSYKRVVYSQGREDDKDYTILFEECGKRREPNLHGRRS